MAVGEDSVSTGRAMVVMGVYRWRDFTRWLSRFPAVGVHPPRLVCQQHISSEALFAVEPRHVEIALVIPLHRVPRRCDRDPLVRRPVQKTRRISGFPITRAHKNLWRGDIPVPDKSPEELRSAVDAGPKAYGAVAGGKAVSW